jgi:hypothetical protein
MNRRDVVKTLGLVSSHVLFPSVLGAFISGCRNQEKITYHPEFFTPEEYDAVTGMIDLIIPATTTKSASGVNTQVFLDQVFSKCLDPQQQALIKEGIANYIKTAASEKDRLTQLIGIYKNAYAGQELFAWFKIIKRFTLIGYFTSEEGTTKASNYVKVPDEYRGEIAMTGQTLNYGKTNLHY